MVESWLINMCDFCNDFLHNNISTDYDWNIIMNKDKWDNHYYIDISHEVNLGCYGYHEAATAIIVNYCPVCGRKLID